MQNSIAYVCDDGNMLKPVGHMNMQLIDVVSDGWQIQL
jgi:hypothetical protein